ncbi:aldehyde dehydrogenase family protein [Vibrio penaeicida]|uniref:aldehyde dehydrogenase family protein n=1 Tax=Vibrio penaeicida TaxID=104609 RepID=UPI001F405F76|nr:aldehyde dehydrogenase family protein [Vibrio penaeicida]
MAVLSLPKEVTHYQMLINGEWTIGSSSSEFERKSPGHGVAVSVYPRGTKQDVFNAVVAARNAFDDGAWSRCSGAERADKLSEVARLIKVNQEKLAYQETLETGKPISQSRGEVMGAAGFWDYAAGQARALEGESFNQQGEDILGLVLREPIGVVGLITPWNFPFFILCERLPFILASGCSVVIKPSELTAGTTLMLGKLIEQAGIPKGVVNMITGPGSELGNAMSHHEDIDMISFTGSTQVGKSVLDGSKVNMKKVGLELGGKNPHVVFADADLDEAADGVAFAQCFNAGQCCVGGSRLLVDSSIADEFISRLKTRLSKVKIGDPLDEDTQVGSMIDPTHFGKVNEYLESGTKQGATCEYDFGVCTEVPENGLYFSPKIFRDVPPEADIASEEIFGPILTVSEFDGYDDALKQANDSIYGLSASIWTKNLSTATKAMRDIQAGRVWVNTTITGGPDMPIGGMKQSGLGRETGKYGIDEYTEVKSVHVFTGQRDMWVS